MVNIQLVRTVVGIIGNIISFGLFLSPLPTFIHIVKKKDVEEFQPLPYLATAFNCMMWVFYGLPIVHPNSTLVWTINGVGLLIELAYLIIYLMYAPKNKKLSTMGIFALEVVCMFIIVLCVLLFAHTHEKRSLVVGILAIILCICMYSAPLGVMRMVIKTKSVEYMPFYLSLASFLNGVCWTIYGFMPVDVNLIVPNGMGALLGAVQLILYACYYKTTPRLGSDGHAKPEVQMSSVPTGSVTINVRS